MRSRIKTITLWLLLAVLVWCALLATTIWHYGAQDHATKSDCIMVLGAAVQGSVPSPVYEERLRHGIHLYKTGFAPKLVFTGGIGHGQEYSEAQVGRLFAIQEGVPSAAILTEELSRTTHQNLAEARAVMQAKGLHSAIIVSDPLHMKRAITMAQGLGIIAVSSPTPTTRYRSLQTKLAFLFRELNFYHYHIITGQ